MAAPLTEEQQMEEMKVEAESRVRSNHRAEARRDRKRLAKGKSPQQFVNDYYARGHAPWYAPYVTSHNIATASALVLGLRLLSPSTFSAR